jgi:hypothetical protein
VLKIHVTKKLLTKLPVDEQGFLPPSDSCSLATVHAGGENVLGNWHANLIIQQRRNCILWLHGQSRFALFTPCLKKADFAQLDWLFQDVLMDTLLSSGASQAQLDRMASSL